MIVKRRKSVKDGKLERKERCTKIQKQRKRNVFRKLKEIGMA